MRAALALLALAFICGAAAAADGTECKAIDGTYRNADAGKPPSRFLDDLVRMPDRRPDTRIVAIEQTAPNVRPKITHHAAAAVFVSRPEGLWVECRDAKGKPLADHIAAWPHSWTCKQGSYEWSEEVYAGLGDNSALVTVRSALTPAPGGDLLLVEERNDPREKPPLQRKEWRFPAIKGAK